MINKQGHHFVYQRRNALKIVIVISLHSSLGNIEKKIHSVMQEVQDMRSVFNKNEGIYIDFPIQRKKNKNRKGKAREEKKRDGKLIVRMLQGEIDSLKERKNDCPLLQG